jgi:lipopolysaccharide export system protein LptC
MSRLPPASSMESPQVSPHAIGRGQVIVALAGRREAQRMVSNRHRRTVTIAKRVLPVLALVLLALLAVLPDLRSGAGITRFAYKTAGTQAVPVSRMSGARYRGMNAQGEPFTVTATNAVQASPNRLDLTRPKGDITLKSGAWMMLNSLTGLYHQKSDLLALNGKVTLYRDDGTTLKTAHAIIDLRNGTADGSNPVAAFGPFGTLHSASGFTVRDRGAQILFKGPSRVTLDHVKAASP